MSSKLPAALAARLAKRGLIPKSSPAPGSVATAAPQFEPQRHEEEEEVIAEDYDDATPAADKPFSNVSLVELKPIDTVRGCPNKYNIYHNCTVYCAKKYGSISERPSRKVCRAFRRLLNKFPIKDSVWEQIWEPGLQTYYFWNTETDQVSWLPPNHPDAKISMPAEKLRRLVRDEHDEDEDGSGDDDDDDEEKNSGSEKSNDDNDDDSDESDSTGSDSSQDKNSILDIRNRFGTTAKRTKSSNDLKRPLDPMDPASYSSIPRGKWSDGL